MKLLNRCDGVNGHYCIGRYNSSGKYLEFYNKNGWFSAGKVFITKKSAIEQLNVLKQLHRVRTVRLERTSSATPAQRST